MTGPRDDIVKYVIVLWQENGTWWARSKVPFYDCFDVTREGALKHCFGLMLAHMHGDFRVTVRTLERDPDVRPTAASRTPSR